MSALDQHWPAFLALLRQAGPTEPLFDFVAQLIGEAIGSKLTTATLFDVPAGRLRRLYTQNAAAYAVGGFKPIPDNQWTETLIRRQQIYTALSLEAIAVDFADWQLIGSLGCELIANLPIIVNGQTIGAFNLLHEAGYYTPERLARVDEVMPFAMMAYLAAIYGGATAG